MTPATILICIGLAAAFGFAIRYLVRNGTCAGCADKDACHSKCSGGCSACGGQCVQKQGIEEKKDQ
jgi:hypothetical protein